LEERISADQNVGGRGHWNGRKTRSQPKQKKKAGKITLKTIDDRELTR